MTSVQAHQSYYAVTAPPGGAQELALAPPAEQEADGETSLFGSDGFTFGDLIDIVNPLQHIPVVSTFYRDQTGDTISAAPRVMGSTLFFGPLGLIGALANLAVEGTTGKDIGDNIASWAGLTHGTTDVAAGPAGTPEMTTAAGFDPDDPVSVWARGEADWARAGQPETAPETKAAAPESAAVADAKQTSTPDAGPLLAQQERWVAAANAASSSRRDVAVLSADIRAASNLYRSVAGWSPEQAEARPRAI